MFCRWVVSVCDRGNQTKMFSNSDREVLVPEPNQSVNTELRRDRNRKFNLNKVGT